MNRLLNMINSRFFLSFLWIIVGFTLFSNGIHSFISSSEYWSIYLSQKLFVFDKSWAAVNLKPLFHLVLSSIYIFNLNDFYHIYATKILFSLNGVLQFFLIYRILMAFENTQKLNFFLTIFLFSSPLFLANYDRIRSDQLVLTLFLLFIWISSSPFKNKLFWQFFLIVLFPLAAFKHFYFLILSVLFLDKNQVRNFFSKIKTSQKVIFFLAILSLVLWAFYFAIPAASYFLATLDTSANYFYNLFIWAKTEWFYIYMSLFPFLIKDFRSELKRKGLKYTFLLQISIAILLIFFPQKTNFFIAGLIPIFYLPSLYFINFLYTNNFFSKTIIYIGLISLSTFCIYLARKTSHLFTFNNPQLIAIDRLSNIISRNNLTYVDGMGVLPKANNMGCFVSPDDEVANQNCINTIKSKTADAIIVTNRLMSLPFDFDHLDQYDYVPLGPNFFIRKNLKSKYENEVTEWMPPSLIFSSEQLY